MRVEHEYKRCGAWAYLAAWDVRRAKLFGRCETRTGIKPFERLVEQVMGQEPYRSATRVLWIMDNVCFHKKRGLTIGEMAKSTWVYKRLRDFRAGIEGMISFLKRCFGLSRCTWRGFASFRAYAWASVLAANLLLLARRMPA